MDVFLPGLTCEILFNIHTKFATFEFNVLREENPEFRLPWLHWCVGVWGFVHMSACTWRPQEGSGSAGAEVAGRFFVCFWFCFVF